MSVVSGYSALHEGMIKIGSRLRGALGAALSKSINGLYEAALGAGAPGTQRVLIHPHDHAIDGGVVLPRGGHWTMDLFSSPWGITCTATSTYYRSTRATGEIVLASLVGLPNFAIDVPWGMDSASTAVGGSAVGLEAKVLIYITSGGNPTFSLRWRNRTTATYSGVKTYATSTTLAWLAWDGADAIPCRGGGRNEIDLEASTNTGTTQIYILAIQISSTRAASQPASVGTATITAALKP